VLDTTIADPVLRLAGGTGTLLLDVSGPTMDGTPVDVRGVAFVELPDARPAGAGAVRTLDAETVLTEDGSAAFPNYEVGTAFDPVSLTLTVGEDCPDAPVDTDTDTDTATDTSRAVSPLLTGLVIAGALAAAAVAVVLGRRRRV
jgi:hypothetical protein